MATDSFRLMRVHPSRSGDGLVQLSIWHSNISSANFDCLSYQWGSQSQRQYVSLNGKQFAVGKNLYDFLTDTYARAEEGFQESYWIDAICIDQENEAERGHQVQGMGDIYRAAERVHIWLRAETVPSQALLTWLLSYANEDLSESLRNEWNYVRHNGYWYRAWIMQEVLLAKMVVVRFPGNVIAWDTFGLAIIHPSNIDRAHQEPITRLWLSWKSGRGLTPGYTPSGDQHKVAISNSGL